MTSPSKPKAIPAPAMETDRSVVATRQAAATFVGHPFSGPGAIQEPSLEQSLLGRGRSLVHHCRAQLSSLVWSEASVSGC
jgi:hypothetical protein